MAIRDIFRSNRAESAESFRNRLSEQWDNYILIVPAIIFVTVVLWLPFFRGVWISLHSWPLAAPKEFVGLENYRYLLFQWDPFWTTVKVTVLQTFMVVPQMAVAIAVTLALYHTKKFQNLLSATFLLPYIIPTVASGTILVLFFDPTVGPFFAILGKYFGIETVYWRSNGSSALKVILGATVWTFWPYILLILIGARSSIDDTLYEVASIYGASKWDMFRNITLPQLQGAILISFALRTIYNLTNTAQVWQITRGGPGYQTTPLGLLLFRFAFSEGEMGLAFAAGMSLMVIGIILAIVFFYQFERTATGEEEVLEHA